MIRKWKVVGNIQFLRNFAAIQDKQVSQNRFEIQSRVYEILLRQPFLGNLNVSSC